MDKGCISVQDYAKLIRASERLAILKEYVKKNEVVCTSDIKLLLGIEEKECEE